MTFLSDNRGDLARLRVPALVMQCSDDAIAPRSVGECVHRELSDSARVVPEASGHCPHLTHARQTIAAERRCLGVV